MRFSQFIQPLAKFYNNFFLIFTIIKIENSSVVYKLGSNKISKSTHNTASFFRPPYRHLQLEHSVILGLSKSVLNRWWNQSKGWGLPRCLVCRFFACHHRSSWRMMISPSLLTSLTLSTEPHRKKGWARTYRSLENPITEVRDTKVRDTKVIRRPPLEPNQKK